MTFSRLSLVALAAISASAFAQDPTFTHLKQLNVGPMFDGSATSGGVFVADVAWDGQSLYLVGANQGGAGTFGTCGVVKVSDPFGTPTMSLIWSRNDIPNNRDSKIVYANGALYVGVGLGASDSTTEVQPRGVFKMDTNGVVDTNFSTGSFSGYPSAGWLSPSEIGNQAGNRTEAIGFDPLTGRLAAVNRGRGFIFEADATSGVVVGSQALGFQAGTNIFGSTWRDVTFDGQGRPLARSNGNILRYSRDLNVAPNSSLFNAEALITPAGGESICQNVEWVGSGAGFSPFIVYNDRTTNFVRFITENGTSIAATLGGSEAIDGVPGISFVSPLLNFKSFTTAQGTFLAVTNGSSGSNEFLSIYGVGTLSTSRTLSGRISLPPIDPNAGVLNGRQFAIELRQGGMAQYTGTITTDAEGDYSLDVTVPAGSYDVWIKPNFTYLGKQTAGVDLSSSATLNVTLLGGDTDGDNDVDIDDYDILANAYGSFQGDPTYNANTDLDADGDVDIDDYDVLATNYGAFGD